MGGPAAAAGLPLTSPVVRLSPTKALQQGNSQPGREVAQRGLAEAGQGDENSIAATSAAARRAQSGRGDPPSQSAVAP
jgi:hypothetical protein